MDVRPTERRKRTLPPRHSACSRLTCSCIVLQCMAGKLPAEREKAASRRRGPQCKVLYLDSPLARHVDRGELGPAYEALLLKGSGC